MKKFTSIPIGLDINHSEQEITIAHHWNQCIDEGVSPDTPIEVISIRVDNFKHTNQETGLSILNTGHVEEVNGKWKLTEKAIKKCKEYLSKN